MKYSKWIGIAASIILVIACFFPWTFHPDLNKTFTGFFSEGNAYGKPGKVFTVLAILAIVFYLVPRLWAKRWNFLITAIVTAFAIKSFLAYSGCYRGICPEKQPAIWVMLVAASVMLLMAVFSDYKIDDTKTTTAAPKDAPANPPA